MNKRCRPTANDANWARSDIYLMRAAVAAARGRVFLLACSNAARNRASGAPTDPHQLYRAPVQVTRSRAQVGARPQPEPVGEFAIRLVGGRARWCGRGFGSISPGSKCPGSICPEPKQICLRSQEKNNKQSQATTQIARGAFVRLPAAASTRPSLCNRRRRCLGSTARCRIPKGYEH
jgi:hypothetical protein